VKKPTDINQKIEAAKVTSDADELRAFARDSFVYVRAGVAINPTAPEDVLLSLVPEHLRTSDDFQVSASLLSRDSLPPIVAHRICAAATDQLSSIQPRDHYPRQFWGLLVSHRSIAFADLRQLLHPQSCPRHLRGYATASSRPDVLALLAHDESGSSAARAKKRLSTSPPEATH
jgi:hypothetical protein